jgi:hypothetical protein
MKRLFCLRLWPALLPALLPAMLFAPLFALLLIAGSHAEEPDKDVPWLAEAEIGRRGALVERIGGFESASDSGAAICAALQPPADDSHKWHFTLVTMRGCSWCERMRADFAADAKLTAWVNTQDYTKSWAHWQVVQIEDQSQAWRWKDFKPTVFPTLIVQPPVNGSWGDPHTIVYLRQGYLKPAELDAAIRSAIQLYATKAFPRHVAWEAKQSVAATSVNHAGFQQGNPAVPAGPVEKGAPIEQAGGWNPPVSPPLPLSPLPLPTLPNYPVQPTYPNAPPQVPPEYQPLQPQPSATSLLSQLLAGLFGGQATGNLLLIAILAWQLYRGFAKTNGIPLVVDDATAAQLVQLLQTLRQSPAQQSPQPMQPTSRV